MPAPRTWVPTAAEALKRIDGKLFATTTEAAAILGYDPRTLRKAIEAGEIPAVRGGNAYRIPTAWIREKALIASAGGGHAA